jgi:hypothetical protein
VLDSLLIFDPTLERVPYETWRSRVAGDSGNALARYLGSFADRIPQDEKAKARPRYDCEETLKLAESAGIPRPRITQQLFQTYFSYLAEHTVAAAAVRAD